MRELVVQCNSLLRPHRRTVGLVLLLTAAAAMGTGAGEPLLQRRLVDGLAQRRLGSFVSAALLFVGLETLTRGANYLVAIATQRLKNGVARGVTLRMMDAFYRVPYGEIARYDRGYHATRTYDEPSRVAIDLVDNLTGIMNAAAMLVSAGIVALWLSWKVVFAVTLIVPFLLRLSRRFSSRIEEVTKRVGEDEAVLKAGVGRAVDGYKTVVIFSLHHVVRAKMTALLDGYYATTSRRVHYSSGFQAVSGLIMAYAELVVMLGAGVQVLRGQLSVGGLFAFMGAYWRIISGANAIIARVPSIAQLKGQLARISDFEAPRRRRVNGSDDSRLELSRVAYHFGGEPVLRDVSIRVEMGQRLLITGPNGSGKTTLALMAAGLLEASEGDQRSPDLTRVSAILLPFGFIPGTIRDNIDFDRLPHDKRERFRNLADQFNLRIKLDQDPAMLSQGEQRKLQVAMALLKEADYYVFDEPLSNVDVESKGAVMEAIFSAARGKGLIVVLHGDADYQGDFDACVQLRCPSPIAEAERGEPLVNAGEYRAADHPTRVNADHLAACRPVGSG